jgi:Ferritin-like domain
MTTKNILESTLAMVSNRRSLLQKLAFAGAALGASEQLLDAQSPAPSDVVQFALNLEYLEAEFYSVAATGQTLEQLGIPISGSGTPGPTTTSFGKVNLGNNLVFTSGSLADISADETAHVMTWRTALMNNGFTPIAKPPINLDALASAGASLQNQQTFLVLARIFEDVGVSAYNGGMTLLAGSPYQMTASRIVSVEGQHVANIRLQIARLGIPTFAVDGADIIPPPTGTNFFSTNLANGLSAYRTTGQVLFLAYGAANVTAGGFFPNGLNGIINMSSAAATSANLS